MDPVKILLVDDSLTVLALERLLLRDEHVELSTASNGRQALEVARRTQPDLILLDVVMPEMDGIECCRQLRASPATRAIKIIMVTTKGNPAMVEAAYKAGCNDFVTKPIDKLDLLTKIQRTLGARMPAFRGEAST